MWTQQILSQWSVWTGVFCDANVFDDFHHNVAHDGFTPTFMQEASELSLAAIFTCVGVIEPSRKWRLILSRGAWSLSSSPLLRTESPWRAENHVVTDHKFTALRSYNTVESVCRRLNIILPWSSQTTDPLGSNQPHSRLQDPTLVSPVNSSPTGTVCRSHTFSRLLGTFWLQTGNNLLPVQPKHHLKLDK